MALCVSVVAPVGLVAKAAVYNYGRLPMSDSGNFTLTYLNSAEALYPSSSTSISLGGYNWWNYFDFNLQFDVLTNDGMIGQYLTGAFWVKFDITSSFSPTIGSGVKISYLWDCPEYSNGDMTYSLYQIDENSVYVLIFFDDYEIFDEYIPGPSDWKVTIGAPCESTSQYGSMWVSNVSSGNTASLSSTSSVSDLASVIASAINSSSDIDQILAFLNGISSNTALLSSVVSNLDITNTALQTIISQITEENSSFYWLLVSAIKAANNSQSPNVQEQETQIEELGNKFAQAESEEAAIVLDAQTAFGNIDFAPVAPTGVAGAAPWVVGFIYDIWNYMGPLQYLMTVGLTIGLAFLLIGFINRVHKK